MNGFIHAIDTDQQGEYVEVHYFDKTNEHRSKKRLQRYDKDVRPQLENSQYYEKNIHWPKIERSQYEDTREVRDSWVPGSVIEVYSRSKEKWFVAYVALSGVDDVGMYIDIHYQDAETKKHPENV
eukprot:UN23768